METRIPITKFSGSGNDFIIIDNRQGVVDESRLSEFIRGVCRRKLSVGADGLILIEASDSVDFRWRFYNSDGGRAEMCGNGARCAARYAYLNGIAGEKMKFETDVGLVEAEILDRRVRIRMTDPGPIQMNQDIEIEGTTYRFHYVNTGVPHVVVPVEDIEAVDVAKLGRHLRFHDRFQPDGTNANFVKTEGGRIVIRTYERGVEEETLACGTGAVAAALTAGRDQGLASPIALLTRSGETLTIYFRPRDDGFQNVRLEGDARLIYTGSLSAEAWQ